MNQNNENHIKKTRRWFFKEGKFYYLFKMNDKSHFSISLGPDFIGALIFLVMLGGAGHILQILSSKLMNPFFYHIAVILHYLTLSLYIYTIACNPGRIERSEDNTFENGRNLEQFGYTYCTYCQLYRPPRACHCSTCDCCYLEHDHHCMMMGQCVAKYNFYSFYGFLICAILYVAIVEISFMKYLSKMPISSIFKYILKGKWITLLASTQ